MLTVRQFENKILDFARQGKIYGTVHLCISEEVASVGLCLALKETDYLFPTQSRHAQHLAKEAYPFRLIAELSGKEIGYCKGISGPVYIFNSRNNNFGSNGIAGEYFLVAFVCINNLNGIVTLIIKLQL